MVFPLLWENDKDTLNDKSNVITPIENIFTKFFISIP